MLDFKRGVQRDTTPFLFGIAIAIVNVAPLLGRSLIISGQIIAATALIVSAGLFLASQKDFRIGLRLTSVFVLIAIYLALVAQSAGARQWLFFLQPNQWSGHERDYVGSKLIMFIITSAPPLATGLMFSLMDSRRKAFHGISVGVVAVSILGAVILIASAGGIYRTDYTTAADWYSGKDRTQFSIISMGILLILGGLFSLLWLSGRRRFNLAVTAFVGLCLLGSIMLIRRVDTVLFATAIAAVVLVHFRQGLASRRLLIPLLAIVAIPALTWPVVTNEFNVAYWANFTSGYKYRAEAAKEVFGFIEDSAIPHRDAGPGNEARTLKWPETANTRYWLLGSGLGFYAANSNNGLTYPHNLLLETYLESGPLAVTALLGTLLLLLVPIASKILTGTVSRYELIGSAAAVVLFLASLKAGDLSSVGPILFFAIAAGSLGTRRYRT